MRIGLYTAIAFTAVAGILGSSRHLINGPTGAVSLLTFSALAFIGYGVLDRIHHALLVACREAEGREASPTAAIIDTQAVKTTEKGGRAGIPLAMTRAKRSSIR